jgi:hypothetical protein
VRPSGARPLYLYIDEAANFVMPELASALEQCRQKGLHFTLAFQHLAQFKSEDERLYKAVKNCTRNKVVFAIPDRQDASELADDLFVGLTDPQLKFMRRRLNHLIEDVREQSVTESVGETRSSGQSQTRGQSRGRTTGNSFGDSRSQGQASEQGTTASRTSARGKSYETGSSSSHTQTENEARNSGYSETRSQQSNTGSNASETIHESGTEGLFYSKRQDDRSRTSGESSSNSRGHSRTETGSDSYSRGTSDASSVTRSKGGSTSVAMLRGRQRSKSESTSVSHSRERSQADTQSHSTTSGHSLERGSSRSRSVTQGSGTRHTAFWEEDPEHWSLEEQRWRAAEIIMRQKSGHCFITTATGRVGLGYVPEPKKFYILPNLMLRFMNQVYERYCVRSELAEQEIAARQQRLLAQPMIISPSTPSQAASPIWNRAPRPADVPPTEPKTARPLPRKRGPKPDSENQAKVTAIIQMYGENWTSENNLIEICDELDRQSVPVPKTWLTRKEGAARSWSRGRLHYPHLVIKAIKDRCKAVEKRSR